MPANVLTRTRGLPKGFGKSLVSVAVNGLKAAWVISMRTWSPGTFTGQDMVQRERNSIASDAEVYSSRLL